MSKRRIGNFVDREVQTFLIVRLCIHWLLFLSANAIGLLLWTRLISEPTAEWETVLSRFLVSFTPILVISIAILPVFVLDSIRLSNRFTGPIFRFKNVLASLAKGNMESPIEFRENDFWKSLAKDFNKVTSTQQGHASSKAASS